MKKSVILVAGLLMACGSEPKKDPAAATATTEAPPPVSTPAATEAPPPAATADASTTAKPDKQTECDGFVAEANSTLDAERIAVDKVCKKDADCMPIKGRACAFSCENGAIPKSEEKEWNESLQKVKDGPCKKWTDDECSKLNTKPAPTCQAKKVWCDKGHCSLKEK